MTAEISMMNFFIGLAVLSTVFVLGIMIGHFTALRRFKKDADEVKERLWDD